MAVMPTADSTRAYQAMMPWLMAVQDMIDSARVDERSRTGLTILVAGYFFGAACGAMQRSVGAPISEPLPETARELAELIQTTVLAGWKGEKQ
ncbi:MAG: hypothetical protein E6G97_01985 [Alphaproteobacteria bacterium]|nr:MAG: hypothetical protein E6G97_01985 [Alphaproteobacteria bacterium]